jgi:hypothetical protein
MAGDGRHTGLPLQFHLELELIHHSSQFQHLRSIQLCSLYSMMCWLLSGSADLPQSTNPILFAPALGLHPTDTKHAVDTAWCTQARCEAGASALSITAVCNCLASADNRVCDWASCTSEHEQNSAPEKRMMPHRGKNMAT